MKNLENPFIDAGYKATLRNVLPLNDIVIDLQQRAVHTGLAYLRAV